MLAASWLFLGVTVVLTLPFILIRNSYFPPHFGREHRTGHFWTWEQEGVIYDSLGVESYRWIMLHSSFGWINPEYKLRGVRSDLTRMWRS